MFTAGLQKSYQISRNLSKVSIRYAAVVRNADCAEVWSCGHRHTSPAKAQPCRDGAEMIAKGYNRG